jgi:hypothetical protein
VRVLKRWQGCFALSANVDRESEGQERDTHNACYDTTQGRWGRRVGMGRRGWRVMDGDEMRRRKKDKKND